MTLLQKLSLAATIGSATFSLAASVPSKTILPDNVIRCEPNASCVTKVAFGHNYKVLTTPRFTVMVALSNEGGYTRADVSITNNTDMPLNMTPEDFRVEVLTPKPKVLLYIPPANLVLPPPPSQPVAPVVAPAQPASGPASAGANFVPSTSDVDVLYAAAKEKALQETADKAATENHLAATSIPPNEATRGRVYFERDKKAHLVNVVLPIAGLVFEFPYAMKK
jgi:hypothetical protein